MDFPKKPGSSESDLRVRSLSCVQTLHDDESTREKHKVMDKWDVILDDERNKCDFAEEVEKLIQFGRSYELTIKEIPRSTQRIVRTGVGRYEPPDKDELKIGDLIQLDPTIYLTIPNIGIIKGFTDGMYVDVIVQGKGELSVHVNWCHKVGRAKFWPDGRRVE